MALDITRVPTPCYVLEETRLRDNLALMAHVQQASGGRIILALKGYAMWSTFPMVREVLQGCTASSLNEALLASEEFGREVHVYAPAYTDTEMPRILELADHLSFNSFSQWHRFREQVLSAGVSCGIRVNPQVDEVETDMYNPCGSTSRLGVTPETFRPKELEGIEGLHFHALCECGADSLERTLQAFEARFGQWIPRMKWINFGGGHLMTREGYDVDLLIRLVRDFRKRYGTEVYLEPGGAVGWCTGPLVASVLDIVHNNMDIAILDTSAAAHMHDVLEMPYRPMITGSGEPGDKAHTYRLGGNTCLAGDVVGDYSFDEPLKVGDRIVLEDMIHYTFVKNTTFNGVNLPSLAIWTSDDELKIVRRFGYEDFKNRLS
ncbi:carboxynorspermidine decarboxylase [Solemya velesiana gill symbiont]|uniref:Carboxynorspermidine/carboxyspermidine decarboxylase n=1 Tax=Solemya velesiana gill symbiont TaxID=1918948 RepID=A0A1T2KS94_9GAMM|nr:carboxynorspermidine decarboxylase [Solemya velesiana gill symbiont]OOZ35702.1 carboxynorspermidine decarboxylase [Solemya velesiana gill symbiont]